MRKKRNEKRNCLISRNNRIFLNKRLSQAKREMVKILTIRKRMINIYIHKKWIVMYQHNGGTRLSTIYYSLEALYFGTSCPEINQRQGPPYLHGYCWPKHRLAYEKHSKPVHTHPGSEAEMRGSLPCEAWTRVCLRKSCLLV